MFRVQAISGTDEPAPRFLDPLELIRFLQAAQTITVHHGALAYLLGLVCAVSWQIGDAEE